MLSLSVRGPLINTNALTSIEFQKVEKHMANCISMSIVHDDTKIEDGTTPLISQAVDGQPHTTHIKCKSAQLLMTVSIDFMPDTICL